MPQLYFFCRQYACLLLCLCGTLSLHATHRGSLAGLVQDSRTATPLAGATVELLLTGQVVFTNDLGHFSFTDLAADSYDLRITYIGYDTLRYDGIQIMDNEQYQLRLSMSAASIDLPSVAVAHDQSGPADFITQLDIRQRPVNNAQELLQLVPGLYLAQHAGGGKAEQIFFRGFDIDHGTDLALTVDGLPVNMVSHAHGQGYADLHFVIPEIVQRIEVQAGPYRAESGNFATAGSIDLHTVNRLDQSFLRTEAGQFGSYRLLSGLQLTPAITPQAASIYLVTEGRWTDGYFDSPQRFSRFNSMLKYSQSLPGQQGLTATLSAFTSRWDASGQVPQRAVDAGIISRFGAIDDTEGGQTSRFNLALKHWLNVSPSLYLSQQLYTNRYDFELYSNFTFYDRDPINGDQIRQRESRWLSGYRATLYGQHRWLGLAASTTTGLQLRHDAVQNNELSYTRNRRETLQRVQFGDVDELNIGAFTSLKLYPTDRLIVEMGLRYDHFSYGYLNALTPAYDPLRTTAGIVSPKLKLDYSISSGWRVFARAGIGFHSNDTRLVIEDPSRQRLPMARGTELGVVCKPSRQVVAQLTAWLLDSEQEFVYVGDEGTVEPSGASMRRGLEGSLRYQWRDWLFVDFDLTYTRARGDNAEAPYIPLAPAWTGSGGFNLGREQGWYLTTRYRWLGDRPADESYTLTATGYLLLDGSLGYRTPRLQIGLVARNLTNEAWNEAQFATTSRLIEETEPQEEIHFTPGTPRSLQGQFTYFF